MHEVRPHLEGPQDRITSAPKNDRSSSISGLPTVSHAELVAVRPWAERGILIRTEDAERAGEILG